MTAADSFTVDPATVEAYQRDGVVVVRGAFSPEDVELARRAVDANLADLSPKAKRASADDDGSTRRPRAGSAC